MAASLIRGTSCHPLPYTRLHVNAAAGICPNRTGADEACVVMVLTVRICLHTSCVALDERSSRRALSGAMLVFVSYPLQTRMGRKGGTA
jgi:hypothetical protein